MEGGARRKFIAKARKQAHKHRRDYAKGMRMALSLTGGKRKAGEERTTAEWFEKTFDPKKNGVAAAFEPNGPLDKAFDPEKNGVAEAFRKFGKLTEGAFLFLGKLMDDKGKADVLRVTRDAYQAGLESIFSIAKSPTCVFCILMYIAEQCPALEVVMTAVEMGNKIAEGKTPSKEDWTHLALNMAMAAAGPGGVEKSVQQGVEKGVMGGVKAGLARFGPSISAKTAKAVEKGAEHVAKQAGKYLAAKMKETMKNAETQPVSKTAQRGIALANFFFPPSAHENLSEEKKKQIEEGWAGVANEFFGRPKGAWGDWFDQKTAADDFVDDFLDRHPYLRATARPAYTPPPNEPTAPTKPSEIADWEVRDRELEDAESDFKDVENSLEELRGQRAEIGEAAAEKYKYSSKDALAATTVGQKVKMKESERIRLYQENLERFRRLLVEVLKH